MDDPYTILESLRWSTDKKVFSPDEPGVLIWLKQITGGITHCCYADDPCDHHRQIEININKSLIN